MKNQFFIVLGIVFLFLAVLGLRVLNESLPGTIVSPRFFLSQVAPGPNEALFFVSPSSGTFNVNDTFQVELRMGTSASVITGKAYLNFNSSLLSVSSISTAGSVFNAYFGEQTSTSNQVKIQAFAIPPGFIGNNGLVATITFRAIGAGTASLTYDASSLALTSDDTNILNIAGSTAGSYAIVVPDTTSPSAPTSVTYNPNPNRTGTHTVTWGGAADNAGGSGIANYDVRRSADGGVNWTTVVTATTGTSYTQSPAVGQGTYIYQARATDNAGNVGPFSTNINTVVVDTTNPSSPISVSYSPNPNNTGTHAVTWSGATDTGGSGIASYDVRRSVDGGGNWTTAATDVIAVNWTQSPAQGQGTYLYQVRTKDNAGNVGSFSTNINTVVVDITAPSRSNNQPTGTLAAGTTFTTISLDTDESATCKYSIVAGTSYDAMPSANTFTAAGAGRNHSINVSSLTDGTTFTYFVKCVDLVANKNATDFPIQFSVASISPPVDITAPSRSNNQPTGTLAAGTTFTTISLTTDESATCKYSTTADTLYDNMTPTFTATGGGTNHSINVSGLTNGTTFTYFVKCADSVANKNATDFPIQFSVASLPAPDTSAPSHSSGQPTGTLSAGTVSTTISLTTDESATCKYSISAGKPYDSMTIFEMTGTGNHSTTVGGLSNGNTFSYYVRCSDVLGNKNTDDFVIQFSVASPPPPPSPGGGGSPPSPSPLPVGALKGDCNSDKKVNVFDLSIMLSNWKKATNTCDLNSDSTINIFDFSILLSSWTK